MFINFGTVIRGLANALTPLPPSSNRMATLVAHIPHAAPNIGCRESIEDTSSCNESSAEELLIEEDHNYVLDNIARLPFRITRVLGGGHSAIVEKVHDKRTGNIFAKKTIRFPQARLRAQKEEHFNNEVNVIRSLKNHPHIIRVYATYVAKREFGLLLQPAADEGSLEDYLGNYWDKREQPEILKEEIDLVIPVLEKAFGCLASGLAFIHGKGVRHKDIKPQNILIHRGSVLYTDFGSSKDANQPGESTTEGLPDFLTKKYSPPEVLAHTKRNYGADVYSLGCVFVELTKALIPNIKYDEGRWFSDIMEHVHQELTSASIPPRWAFIPRIITAMTSTDRERRPSAAQIYKKFSQHAGFLCAGCYHKSETQSGTLETGTSSIKCRPDSLANATPQKISFDKGSQKKDSKSIKGILKEPTKIFPFVDEVDSNHWQSLHFPGLPAPRPLPPDGAPPYLSLFDDQTMNHEYLREAAQWIHAKFTDALADFVDQVEEAKKARHIVQQKRQDLQWLRKRVSQYDMMFINSVRNSISKGVPLERRRLLELSEAAKDVRNSLTPFESEYEVLEVELGAQEYKVKKKYAQIEKNFQEFFRLTVNPSPPPSIPSQIEYEESSSDTTISATSRAQDLLSIKTECLRLFQGALIGRDIRVGQVPRLPGRSDEQGPGSRQMRLVSNVQNRSINNGSIRTAATISQPLEQLRSDRFDASDSNINETTSQEYDTRQRKIGQDLVGLAAHMASDISAESSLPDHGFFSGVEQQDADRLFLDCTTHRTQSILKDFLINFESRQERVDNWLLHKLRSSLWEVYVFRRFASGLVQEEPSTSRVLH